MTGFPTVSRTPGFSGKVTTRTANRTIADVDLEVVAVVVLRYPEYNTERMSPAMPL